MHSIEVWTLFFHGLVSIFFRKNIKVKSLRCFSLHEVNVALTHDAVEHSVLEGWRNLEGLLVPKL